MVRTSESELIGRRTDVACEVERPVKEKHYSTCDRDVLQRVTVSAETRECVETRACPQLQRT